MVYHILFNPFAGNGRCTQDCKKVEPFLKGGECRFTDMTKISDYGAFWRAFPMRTPWCSAAETAR